MDHDHHDHTSHVMPVESPKEYAKFAGVIFGIIVIAVGLTMLREWSWRLFVSDFMGIFFLVFATFKLVNIEMFAITYSGYDIIARRFIAWGYIFPIVELFLAFSYLLSPANSTLNLVTMGLTGVAGYGVWQEVRKKSKIPCACLGTIIKLPLSKISFVEDFTMLIMAAMMLFI